MTTKTVNRHEVIINGQSITRNSEKHVYTHVVIGFRIDGETLEVLGWCGSKILAQKLVQKYQSAKKSVYGCSMASLFRGVQAVENGSIINL